MNGKIVVSAGWTPEERLQVVAACATTMMALAQKRVTNAADVYDLGNRLYHLATLPSARLESNRQNFAEWIGG